MTYKDHPRVCGEKCHAHLVAIQDFGITPACAGKSGLLLYLHLIIRDHPRVCGEKTKKIP